MLQSSADFLDCAQGLVWEHSCLKWVWREFNLVDQGLLNDILHSFDAVQKNGGNFHQSIWRLCDMAMIMSSSGMYVACRST
eukprot:10279620-Ditylum_brightwellii.AAC.1